MFYHQSLSEAIEQLKSTKVSKKNSMTSYSNKFINNSNQYRNDTQTNKASNTAQMIIFPTSSDNKTSFSNNSNLSTNMNRPIIQAKPTYSSSLTSPKLIKPTALSTHSDHQIKSSSHIHPPDSDTKNDNVQASNPRFFTHSISPPASKPPISTQSTFKRSPNRRTKPNEHVQFGSILNRKITKSDVNLYYKFGLRLSNQISSQKRASYYLKFAADHGHVDSMIRYATIQYDGYPVGNPRLFRIEKNRQEAARYFKKAADMGDARGMRRYRSMLYDGDGIEKDRKAAVSMYKREADRGVASSISQYATMLYLGDGVERNLNEAVRYFRLAVDKGDRFGTRMLAYLYLTGSGVECSMKEAVYYYKIAADMGDEEALKQIVKIVDIGGDNFLNEKEIEKYCKMAADRGDSDALNKYKSLIAAKKFE